MLVFGTNLRRKLRLKELIIESTFLKSSVLLLLSTFSFSFVSCNHTYGTVCNVVSSNHGTWVVFFLLIRLLKILFFFLLLCASSGGLSFSFRLWGRIFFDFYFIYFIFLWWVFLIVCFLFHDHKDYDQNDNCDNYYSHYYNQHQIGTTRLNWCDVWFTVVIYQLFLFTWIFCFIRFRLLITDNSWVLNRFFLFFNFCWVFFRRINFFIFIN